MKFSSIHPHGGDQRTAFEELSYLLFAREKAGVGIAIRREGAGGDAGLEGAIVDRSGCVLIGIQAKFFIDKLGSLQWRDLSNSIQTALQDNAADGTLREIVVTLPVKLNQTQQRKWDGLVALWRELARSTGYKHAVKFTLWHASRLLGLLLQPANRGLLLHYFEIPDFGAAHCTRKTRTSLRALGNRYRPDLHTHTEAEDILHTFLRSERCRQQYVDEARERITATCLPPPPDEASGTDIHALHQAAAKAWQQVLPLLGDGIALPASFDALKSKLDATVDALTPLVRRLHDLIPPPQQPSGDDFRSYHRTRTPAEEAYDQCRRWTGNLLSFARYLGERAHADLPCLLLTGEPGMGKTQVLAEICNRYAEEGGVVLFREAALFTSSDTPWNQFLSWADFPRPSVRDFLETLSAAAAATGMPALLCIDALNETPDRHLWCRGLREFAAEILPHRHNIKLIVSCRSDYLRQTLPSDIREHRAPDWHHAEHEGLGVNVFEALPKYLSAYRVQGIGVPPLAAEFENPLFLRTFCEAFEDRTPPPGSLGLGSILHRYAERKAELIQQRIDCEPNKMREALRQLAGAMQADGSLLLPETEAQLLCQHQHAPTETTRSLYRALLAENILAELPDEDDALGPRNVVRFTYERIWDYFLSTLLLPKGKSPSPTLLAQLADSDWRAQNSGVVGLLTIRLAEERRTELCDLISPGEFPPDDLLGSFVDSLPWRTSQSVTDRTLALFEESIDSGHVSHEFDSLLRFAPNPAHPWNAHHLHARLASLPLGIRDREWTLWINEQLTHLSPDSPLHTLLNWAEHGRLELLPDEHIFLLATALAWCLSTTAVKPRERVASALTRLLVGRLEVATLIVEYFLSVDDPYVQEYVLLAAAGAAQHAPASNPGLTKLAVAVHSRMFAGKVVPAHLFVRHYATEICHQAQQKGALPAAIAPASFRPPFRSRWPKIWTAARVQAWEKQLEKHRTSSSHGHTLFGSVEPGHPGYGSFGRYVLGHAVGHFQNRRLTATPATKGRASQFDSQLAKRFILQRVYETGWDATKTDQSPTSSYRSEGDRVERLSKKYQWIALRELLGHLTDHFHFSDYQDGVKPFRTVSDISRRGLLDPYVVAPRHQPKDFPWQFKPPALPWWRGGYNPLPRPLSHREQRLKACTPDRQDPAVLLALKDDAGEEWLTLSCFHRWYEPVPLWLSLQHAPQVDVKWAVQSYLVKPEHSAKLLARLKSRDFPGRDSHWMDEPEFEEPLAALRTYPQGQDALRDDCELDERYDSQYWGTGACCTTCRLDEAEEHKRFPGGSFPSPQLARLGALHWTGRGFDFAQKHGGEPVVQHHGGGYKGACVAQRAALLQWLRRKKLQLVWRCFSERYRSKQPDNEPLHIRRYWAAYSLTAQGEVVLAGGGTCAVRNGLGPEESLPWQM